MKNDYKKETMVHLVNSAHGIYTYYVLACNYTLTDDMGGRLESCKEDFNPDTCEEWMDSIDYDEPHVQMSVGDNWRVESIEGDLYAINPSAEWDEERGEYVLTKEGV